MAKRKKRDGKVEDVSEVLQGLFENVQGPLANSFQRYKLSLKWEKVVGSTIAQNSSPVSYFNGILYLKAKNSMWLHQLNFITEEIREKVNLEMGFEWAKEVKLKLDDRP